MSFNERVFSILMESSCSHSKKVAKDECSEACESFADTIGNGHNFSDTVVPKGLKFSEETMPLSKAVKTNLCTSLSATSGIFQTNGMFSFRQMELVSISIGILQANHLPYIAICELNFFHFCHYYCLRFSCIINGLLRKC